MKPRSRNKILIRNLSAKSDHSSSIQNEKNSSVTVNGYSSKLTKNIKNLKNRTYHNQKPSSLVKEGSRLGNHQTSQNFYEKRSTSGVSSKLSLYPRNLSKKYLIQISPPRIGASTTKNHSPSWGLEKNNKDK